MIRIPEHQSLSDLGAREYWIVDAESGDVLIKSPCRPGVLAPGLRVEVPGPFATPGGRPSKRPGFLSGLGFFEIVSPSGATIATFSCRPFFTAPGLAVKEVRAGQEKLVTRGAAMAPKGTILPRRRVFREVRR